MLDSVAQEYVKRIVNAILTGPIYDNASKSSPERPCWAQECEPSNDNGSTVERLTNYASVGKKDGSRAYSAKRFAQVRPTAHLLLIGSTSLGRMTVYQRDSLFAWFYSEKVVEHHPKNRPP